MVIQPLVGSTSEGFQEILEYVKDLRGIDFNAFMVSPQQVAGEGR